MSYTHENYTALKQAIASGVRSVSYSDKTVQYRDLEEMQKILRLMEAELFPEKITRRRKLARISRGF